MITVTSHAAPAPITSTHKNHDCVVGRGSLSCQRSKAKAATADTMTCKNRIGGA